MFDYFTKKEAEQVSFYRIPKVLFTERKFHVLSTEAKVLYGLFLDRVSLSKENNWLDDQGRVYIIYTLEAMREALGCSEKSAIKYLSSLEEIGLIEKRKQGQGKPAILYVKNIYEEKKLQSKKGNNSSCGVEKTTVQELENVQGNYTESNDLKENKTNLILSENTEKERMDKEWMGYETYLHKQWEIESLKKEYPLDTELIQGIQEMAIDVLCSRRKTMVIAGDEKPLPVIKGRFMKLKADHLRYVLSCVKENRTKVRSIKQYLLAALYNAPMTIDGYYQAEANFDLTQ